MKEKSSYTPEPKRGEDLTVTLSRVITWQLFQITPEQRKKAYESFSGRKLDLEIPVVADDSNWQKAIIRLCDEDDRAIVGLQLNHPGIKWESFSWNELEIVPRVTDDEESLKFNIANNSSRERLLYIRLQNIYRDEETETEAQVLVNGMSHAEKIVPFPTLVEDVPSILVFLSKQPNFFSLI